MNKRRRRLDPVVVTCVTCGWTASASTWRPAKRKLLEHASQKHERMVA